MIKHILTIIKNERRQNIGIWMELLIVSLFLWYIADSIYTSLEIYYQPLGFNIEHTYIAKIGYLNKKCPDFQNDINESEEGELLQKILSRIQASPMVEYAAVSLNSKPYTGGNRYGTIYSDSLYIQNVLYRAVTEDFFHVYQYQSRDSSTEHLAKTLKDDKVILSESVAEDLFPNGKAIGKEIKFKKDDQDKMKVGAISKNVRYVDNTNWNKFIALKFSKDYFQIFSRVQANYTDYSIRIKPEEDYDVINRFRKSMEEQLRIGNYYLQDIFSSQKDKDRLLSNFWNDIKMKSIIVFFLLCNILLGVTGIFWFRTQSRKAEIGLRLSLGDTPIRILKKYFIEGFFILLLAMLPNIPIMLILAQKEILEIGNISFGFSRLLIGFTISFVLLALTIILGIYLPTRKYIHIPPAEALRDE